MKLLSRALCMLILLHAVYQVACWRTVITSTSPDQRHTIRIKESCFGPDCTIKAELFSGFLPQATVVMPGDAWLGLVHITWSSDSAKAGVLAANRLGIGGITTGFDTRVKKPIPFGVVRDMVASDIERTYQLTPAELSGYRGDPIQWALRDDAGYDRWTAAQRQARLEGRL